MAIIAPHGNKLIDLQLKGAAVEVARREANGLTGIQLSPREQGDLELLASGALSPLTGFMGEADYRSVVERLRLSDGTVWPIPITLAPPVDVADRISIGDRIVLLDSAGRPLAILHVQEKFTRDKNRRKDRCHVSKL
jgi:ATP sulfurylase